MTQSSGEGWVPTPGQSKSEPLGRISTTSTGLATETSSSISIGSDAEKTGCTKIRFSLLLGIQGILFHSTWFPKIPFCSMQNIYEQEISKKIVFI